MKKNRSGDQGNLFPTAAGTPMTTTCYNCEYCDVDISANRGPNDTKLIFCSAHVGRFDFTHAQNCAYFETAAELMSEKRVDSDGRVFTERFFVLPDGTHEPFTDKLGAIPASLIELATGRKSE